VKLLRFRAQPCTFEVYRCGMESYIPSNAFQVPHHGGMGVSVGQACKERVEKSRIDF